MVFYFASLIHPNGLDCPFVDDLLFRRRFENPQGFWSHVLSTHDSGVCWSKMVENPVLLDLQHLDRFLWLLFKATLSSLKVVAAMVLCDHLRDGCGSFLALFS